MEYDLTTGSVTKKLIAFALPVLGANFLQALYGTVDLLIVGKFSDNAAVSAVSTGSMTMQTITAVVTGLTMGSTILLGQAIGASNYKRASSTVASSFLLFSVLGVLLSALVVLFALPVSVLMNAPAEALEHTASYLRICGFGSIFIVFYNFISGMFRGIGDSRTPLLLVGISCVINIAADLLLVKGFGMGAAGAAAATVFAQAASVLFAALSMRRKGLGFALGKADFKVRSSDLLTILKYGLPISAQELLTGVSFMVILAILNSFGLVASAGVGVAEKICGLIFIVPGAVMSAVSVFSAQNVGAGKPERAKKSMLVGMAIAVSIGLAMFYTTFFHGVAISQLFANDLEVCRASADYLRSYSIDCVLVGISFCMMGYLNGNGETLFVAIQGILCTFLVRIPVSYFMSKMPGVTLFQIGFATPLATVLGILLILIYIRRFEKRIRLQQS